jgi:glutamate dehydrogenase
MLSLRDDARADLLERAIEAAGRSGRRDDGSESHNGLTFLQCYYRHIPVEDLADRDPVDVYGAALSHRALAANRPQGTAAVRVHTPSVEANGWASGHTVVEVVTDDMPFLVDSVTSALAQAGQAIHLVIHPQVVVRRSITGELLDVVDVPVGQGGPDTALESWIHVEIGRVTDVEVTTGLERTLLSVLRDVRESVEDWPKMRDTALRVADELSIRPPVGIDDAEISEAWELLRWLADDHFTFLGVREYELVSEDGEDALRAIPGTGLGILRSDQLVSS